MLETRDLVKQYDGQLAVDHLSLEVKQGGIFGLLGPNGAGKSSFLRMVTGITLPDEGEVLFEGEPFNIRRHMNEIGYMPEERGLYKKMKVYEHLMYLGQLKGLSKNEVHKQIEYWFGRLDMGTWTQKKVEDLSKGMSQKLQFVATVLHQPKLLILDEPFSGLDPVNTDIIKDEIFQLAESGTTVIFSTHRMEQVEEVCKRIVLMNEGKKILEGEVDEIKQRFKKNQYALKLSTKAELPFESLNGNTPNEYIVQLTDQFSSNDILKQCLDMNLPIESFQEKLPTLNEIFISLVSTSAIRQFETA